MTINKIKISNFRCFSDETFHFGPKYTIIFGNNAIGKSTILEAVHLISVCKSFRTNDYRELIRENQDYFYVEGFIEKDNIQDVFTFYADKNVKKAKINNFNLVKLSDYVGSFNVVCFSSLDFLLIKGNPTDRRKMLDLVFCQISKDYLSVSNYYKKFLKDRNALLKRLILENSKQDRILLETVSEQLIFYGKQLIKYRRDFCKTLSSFAGPIHNKISENKEQFQLVYESCVDADYEEKFSNAIEEDLRKGYTTIGPHRDDYIFIINNKNIMVFGSQGQQKNSVISLKLAMAELINEIKKEAPTLLLDDVFSELDKNRQNALVRNLNQNFQTIITTASISDIDKSIIDNSLIINLEKRSV